MPEPKVVTACVLLIGDEILSGRTQDANLAFLAQALGQAGIRVVEARVIPDREDAIVRAVNACRSQVDYVFTTGGIGPTHDDITAAAIARAFGLPLHRHAEAMRRLQRQYDPADLNPARLRMADMPLGAELIDNPVSQAPGFRIGNVFVLPGVPRILQAMVGGLLARLEGGRPLLTRTVAAFATEGSIAEALATVQAHHPEVSIGSYPFVRDNRLGTALVARSTDPLRLDAAVTDIAIIVRAIGVEPVVEP
ncbi:MAG: competence/damage-inducible protein A [Rhodospirillales bacterium]|nr:MAG: competence/damage-inducible protein A [Rhodospirillales bacterium]